jgi:hypothetical protein
MKRLTIVTPFSAEQYLQTKLCYSNGEVLTVLYYDTRGLLHERRITRPYTLEVETYEEHT